MRPLQKRKPPPVRPDSLLDRNAAVSHDRPFPWSSHASPGSAGETCFPRAAEPQTAPVGDPLRAESEHRAVVRRARSVTPLWHLARIPSIHWNLNQSPRFICYDVNPRTSCAASKGTSSCGQWPIPSSSTQSATHSTQNPLWFGDRHLRKKQPRPATRGKRVSRARSLYTARCVRRGRASASPGPQHDATSRAGARETPALISAGCGCSLVNHDLGWRTMASSGKRKTTFAKLARERRLQERRLDKQAKKDARKRGAELQAAQPRDTPAAGDR